MQAYRSMHAAIMAAIFLGTSKTHHLVIESICIPDEVRLCRIRTASSRLFSSTGSRESLERA